MPERVYMNRVPGEERIHVEITAAELGPILGDLAQNWNASAQALTLWRILEDARQAFNGGA